MSVVEINTAANPAFVDLSTSVSFLRRLSLTPQTQVTTFIRVDGAVLDADGNAVATAVEVTVETFAQQNTSGTITTNTGTQRMNTGVPAGKLSSAVILTTAGGIFAFTVETLGAGNEDILARVTTNNGVVGQVNLHFVSA